MTAPVPPRFPDRLDPDLERLLNDEQVDASTGDDALLLARVKARVMSAIRAHEPDTAAVVGGWVPLTPLIEQKILWRDGQMLACLLRCQPGAVLPAHLHACDEEVVVLEGSVQMDDHLVLHAGDRQHAPAGSRHGPASTATGALVFLRGALVF